MNLTKWPRRWRDGTKPSKGQPKSEAEAEEEYRGNFDELARIKSCSYVQFYDNDAGGYLQEGKSRNGWLTENEDIVYTSA